ncbi:AmmeMemoRadiSam system protein A, partial [bacterium]|nr:AmmeMemoRadiSam system protein A [bacterium]
YQAETPDTPPFNEERAVFVTLTIGGELRGCIGQMIATEPLYQAVIRMAHSAAFHDTRFGPLSLEELQKVKIEISILTPMKRVNSWEDIVMERDGVHVSQGYHSGVFLPQVARDTGWDKETFLRHLCSGKAGLPADAYKDRKTEIKVFQVYEFSE